MAEIEDPEIARALTLVLRAVRRHRGLTAREVAARMGLKLRTYQHYEAGSSRRFSFKNLRSFAAAMDCDFNGLMAAILTEDPTLAARGCDNKLVSITLASLKALSANLGDQLGQVEPRVLIAALEQAFGQVEAEVIAAAGSASRGGADES